MAIVHTPRTLVSIARGMLRRRRRLAVTAKTSRNEDPTSAATATTTAAEAANIASNFAGFVPAARSSSDGENENAATVTNPHVYKSRANLFWDVDYIGHMNNASYLTHAEYARWEWTAETGALQAMYNTGSNFIVTNCAVRFRKEISANTKFEIHSTLKGIDERNLWMYQTFRNINKDGNGDGRIMSQVLVQAVVVQNRKILPPKIMLDTMGVPTEIIDSLLLKDDTDNIDTATKTNDNNNDNDATSFLKRFKDLDDAFRDEANADDKRLLSLNKS